MTAKRPLREVTGILLLDKPQGISSNGALQRARRLYQADKAGHTGSLDPLATGLLPICFGQATKLGGYLLEADKRYHVRARLGQRTDTGDADGTVVASGDPAGATREELEGALARFTGEVRQRPPMYSALKQGGRRLYELAREGREVAREERVVRISELRLTGFGEGCFDLDVRCSKGTYVRTLVEDLAASVGQLAHVAALRRLEVTPFGQYPLRTFDELEHAAGGGLAALDAFLLPALAALPGWPRVLVDAARADYLAHGQPVRVAGAPARGGVAVVSQAGALLGIGEINPDGLVAPKRWMASAAAG